MVNYATGTMELLLNLVWLSLALGALVAFTRIERASAQLAHIPWRRSLVALACVLVLLFPIISASDDLHPTQAMVEDVSKRVQLAVVPLHLLRTSPPLSMMPAMAAACLMCALVVLRPFRPLTLTAGVRDGATIPSSGRAPPSCWN
jgi:hypothetical protein